MYCIPLSIRREQIVSFSTENLLFVTSKNIKAQTWNLKPQCPIASLEKRKGFNNSRDWITDPHAKLYSFQLVKIFNSSFAREGTNQMAIYIHTNTSIEYFDRNKSSSFISLTLFHPYRQLFIVIWIFWTDEWATEYGKLLENFTLFMPYSWRVIVCNCHCFHVTSNLENWKSMKYVLKW